MMSHEETRLSKLETRLRSLSRTANMMRSMHSVLADRYGCCQAWLRYGTLFFSTVFLSLTFISDDFVSSTMHVSLQLFKWIRAVPAIVNFFLGLVLLIWRPADLAAQHRLAVRHYTRARYEIGRMLDRETPISESDVAAIVGVYLDDTNFPPIPEKRFLSLKQYHLRKLALSKYLDTHPFVCLWKAKLCMRFSKRTEQNVELTDKAAPHVALEGSMPSGNGGAPPATASNAPPAPSETTCGPK